MALTADSIKSVALSVRSTGGFMFDVEGWKGLFPSRNWSFSREFKGLIAK